MFEAQSRRHHQEESGRATRASEGPWVRRIAGAGNPPATEQSNRLGGEPVLGMFAMRRDHVSDIEDLCTNLDRWFRHIIALGVWG